MIRETSEIRVGPAKVVPRRKGKDMLDDMDKLVSLCKRRGFIFPSSEVYGGINGFWDYGPLGVELKRNIKDALVARQCPDARRHGRARLFDHHEPAGLGSLGACRRLFRPDGRLPGDQGALPGRSALRLRVYFPGGQPQGGADRSVAGRAGELAGRGSRSSPRKRPPSSPSGSANRQSLPSVIPYMQLAVADREKVIGPSTDDRGTLTEPRAFNLMFKTFVGALENETNVAYLRPETAQGIFANFKNVVDTGRVKLPFGIAQIGKSFRNEINPRNFTFRSREFEQMEIEYFCRPEEAKEWYAYWRQARFQWYVDLGLRSDRLRLRDHDQRRSWRSIRRPPPTSNTLSRSARASWRGSRIGGTTTSAST